MSLPAEVAPPQASGRPVRVMLVDDSAVVRGLIRRFIDPEPGIEVVATAGNGEAAVATLRRSEVDVIVLDVEMPVMDGITAIPHLLAARPSVKIVMASTLTERNADISLKAMALGAADYLAKPTTTGGFNNAAEFRRELVSKIQALGGAAMKRPAAAGAVRRPEPVRRPVTGAPARPEAVAIGSSTGGPQALTRVLKGLRSPMRLPVFVTQHMPPTFTQLLAAHLTRDTGHNVIQASDGLAVEPGTVYLAPGDFHMLIERKGAGLIVRTTNGEKENYCRPAVDPMLRSLVACYGKALLTVILTGMGHDGLAGCRAVVEAGGTVLAQDEATSVVWGMPGAVASAGLCHAVKPIDALPAAITAITEGRNP